jgi:hypothetical protein
LLDFMERQCPDWRVQRELLELVEALRGAAGAGHGSGSFGSVRYRNNVITILCGTVRIGRWRAGGKTVRGVSWIVRRRSRARIAAVKGVT